MQGTTGLVAATLLLVAAPAAATPQPLINYFQPMPIVGKLSTTVWGASTVGSRDPANGLEDNGANGGAGPQQQTKYYWDGKIIKGEDGKYHLYASYWAHSNGFGPPASAAGTGWESSIPMQAISDQVMGPYVFQGECYTRNQQGTNQGHNTTAVVAPSGTAPFTLSVGEIVPGQMFSSPSANGPWTLLGLTNTNTNGHNNCGGLTSNFTLTVGSDNRFWATSRGGCVMDSDQVVGPYKVETDSVLPNLENNDNNDAEDEVIWYSGGYYHVVYNYWNVQRAYHVMSKDGITNWKSTGLAYQASQSPANSSSNWLRYTDGTVNQWHNMERVGVYQETGHVTHFTFAVTDVDKNSSAVNSGGSKILVVPFNGVQFDCDNGDAASCAEAAGGAGGAGGAAGTAGTAGNGGAGGAAGAVATGGAAGIGGAGGQGGSRGAAGAAATGGAIGTGGGTAGGAPASTGGKSGDAGGNPGNGGQTTGPGGAAGQSGSTAGSSGGCACDVAPAGPMTATLLWLATFLAFLRRRRCRHH